MKTYKRYQAKGFSGSLTLEDCSTLMLSFFGLYSQSTLIIDALDECDSQSRHVLIRAINVILERTPKPVKILISSRNEEDIKVRFCNDYCIEVNADDICEDVENYLRCTIDNEFRWRNISQETKSKVTNHLHKACKGMFLWVVLQLNTLTQLRTSTDVMDRLGKLPKSLQSTYDELSDEIENQEGTAPLMAKRAIQWLIAAIEPLTPEALVEAACQSPDSIIISAVDICVRFVSKSRDRPTSVDDENVSSLSEYAHRYWYLHCNELKGDVQDDRLLALLRRFFGAPEDTSSSNLYHKWCSSRTETRLSGTPIFGVCMLGFPDILKGWYDEGFRNLELRTEKNISLLGLACIASKYGTARLLLGLGADSNSTWYNDYGLHESPLSISTGRGDHALTALLLEKGANFASSSWDSWPKSETELCFPVDVSMKIMLGISEAARTNACRLCMHPFLFRCSPENMLEILNSLLSAGVTLEKIWPPNEGVRDVPFRHSTLGGAICKDSLPQARALLAAGADLYNTQAFGDHDTGLHLAAAVSSIDMMDLLLKTTKRPIARDRHGRSPLHIAASTKTGRLPADPCEFEVERVENPDTCLNLLEAGIDVNLRDNDRNTALQFARAHDHFLIAQTLLDRGAEEDEDEWDRVAKIREEHHRQDPNTSGTTDNVRLRNKDLSLALKLFFKNTIHREPVLNEVNP
ncbi:MAG: hypothetical protein Q9227_004920 [Pyrenula ochraceoflavens]